ncbi:hypothetical protein H310_06712 [Aphanomyces invadans]|uniref:MYND-type domain-containing protein n=1 Tax=Aphanomyces invadans TaxID=157072 RepID=A0A024U4D4_9STRA|nr:hypothetical protein H310_06712 [Aphanomyces invadans]ETW01095.1 hypothetical protein H310_06712 [Aphanomyces invadans]|eukprot:XP_008870093.1 hypothetical protein H310_06712 [Aphanomyces invadans]
MDDVIACDDCHVFQNKKEEFRESQWDNPRPVCNSCSTKRAWAMFATDIAACPNARVIHNRQHVTSRNPSTGPPESGHPLQTPSLKNAKPEAWEHVAAERIKRQLDDATPRGTNLDAIAASDVPAIQRNKWCVGCSKGVPSAQRCSQCKRVLFCSTACQKSAWAKHKPRCHAIPVETSVAATWNPVLAATRSSNPDESYRAFTQVQAWMAEDPTAAAATFRGLDGVSLFLHHLETVDLESTWQSLLLLTRFIESSAGIAADVIHLGGVATLLALTTDSIDFRIQASAVVAVGTLIASSTDDAIALTAHLIDDLDAVSAFLTVLLYASTLEDDVELVACVQSTALLLQLLEHHPDALSQLASFRAADTGDDIGSLLTRLVGKIDTIYRLNRSTGVQVGHHLYLNVLGLVGAVVHAHPECKPQFVKAKLVAVVCNIIQQHCQILPLAPITVFEAVVACVVWFVCTFIYDWRVHLTATESMEVLDRLVPLLTPFLSDPEACEDFTNCHRGIALASSVFRCVLASNVALAPRMRLSALDLFVCAILPPFDVPDTDRHCRIHANVDVVLTTLNTALKVALTAQDSVLSPEDDVGLSGMLLAEAVKCSGLVAHFGQAMPPVQGTNIPKALVQVLGHEHVHSETKWTAMAALIQWDMNGNSVASGLGDVTAVESVVSTLSTAAQANQLDLIQLMRDLLERHKSPVL